MRKDTLFGVSLFKPAPRKVQVISRRPIWSPLMASWVVKCPHCGKTFHHSTIEDTFRNFFWPEKPMLPEEGQSLACKDCGKESVYTRTDLRYQR
jgi:endogenous inhibitor of DNA gyrase (YacG/DUF329 family)